MFTDEGKRVKALKYLGKERKNKSFTIFRARGKRIKAEKYLGMEEKE